MSVYEMRYNVHANMYSSYTDDPAKALEYMLSDPERGFCTEGYADEYYHERQGVTEYRRRTTGPVSKETLAYRAQRQVVQNMLEAMRS